MDTQALNNGNIVTLTLNPAVDISYRVKQLVAGGKSSALESRYDAGGNGINVSRALKLLGVEAYSYCAVAGAMGDFFCQLLEQQVDHLEAFRVAGDTRVNCAVQQLRPPEEFKVGGVGPELSDEDVELITSQFLALAKDGVGVLTGSLPQGLDDSIYMWLGSKLREQGAKVVIDANSQVLESALEVNPYLIKPNREELETMCGRVLPSVTALAEESRKLQQRGVDNVCVSLADEGAIFTNKDNSYFGTAPKIYPVCSTGSGDAMLAGILVALVEGKSAEDVVKLGLACGSGTTAQSGTGLFDPDKLGDFEESVVITTLDI